MTSLLEARDISVSYGKIEAVRQVSLSVKAGQIVTVIGPNGAGKSSLLKALMGVLPYRGAVEYAGRNVNDRALEDRVDAGLYLVFRKNARSLPNSASRKISSSVALRGAKAA